MMVKDNVFHAVGRRMGGGIPSGLTYRHDDLDLIRDDKDRPIWNMANAITLLTDHGDWHGVLAYNQFTMRRVLLHPVPGQGGGEYPRPLEDDDYSAAQAWFNRNGLGIMDGPERLVPHGWRYTAAVQLSDAGCSDDEVQTVTGHKTMEMVRKYRAKRDQRAASKRAQEKRSR